MPVGGRRVGAVVLATVVLTALAGTSSLCPAAAVHPPSHVVTAAAPGHDAAGHDAHGAHADHGGVSGPGADATPLAADAELPDGHAGVAHLVMSCLVLVAFVAIRLRATGRPWSSVLADPATGLLDVRRAPDPPVPKSLLVPELVAAR